jgi:hypothetical protein
MTPQALKGRLRMSALLERPLESPQQQTLPRPTPRFRHSRRIAGSQPDIALRVRIVERTRTRTNVWTIAAAKAGLFFMLMGGTYAASSLSGHVLVEGARQQRINAIERAAEAKSAEAVLVKKIDVLTSSVAIERWAVSRGFASPDGIDDTKTLLARR